ncbi:alpha/beta fold hydrolase [Phytoactinopolyspora sp. XMNu-373]|uniref:Alpha/beta fold hydrolase n=1 Tax=Phytoactinopolyspora mesophila TaxID=2650750 RepID=A0A7K3M655_9ACTN|nr:alpha/beta fold hydrolase [Phytoactinopolyspora mesophila]
MLKGVVIVVVIVVALLAILWLTQRRLIYLPDNSAVPPAADVIQDAEDVTLTTTDGLELGAWYIPPQADERNVTVLVANGNGGNRASRAPLAEALSEAGFATLLFDYRGYGGNPGDPNEDGLALDARAAYNHLVDDRGVSPDQLLYFGESLGAGVVSELATEHPPAGLLLRSPFTDLAEVGQRHYPIVPVGLLLWDRYPVAEHVSTVDVPTTVVYGTSDSIVPPGLSQDVAAAAAGPVEEVDIEGAGHNDSVMFGGPEIVDAVVGLAERATTP